MTQFPSVTRLAAATAALLVVCTLVGIGGLGVGELVPDRLVAERLHEARDDGSLTATDQAPTRLGGIADHFTECITISVGLGESADAGFFETLAEGTHLGPCAPLTRALDSFDQNGQLPEGSSYLRYWHGSSAVFRPVLALFGLPTLRILTFGALVLATISLGRRVRRVAGTAAAAGLLAPLVLTTDYMELTAVAHHALALAVALAGGNLALAAAQGNPNHARAWFSAVVSGAAFVYVDLLTNVPGAWMLPAALTMVAARQRGLRTPRIFGLGLTAGLGWIVGYAGMWFGKWVFAAAVLGRERVQDDVRDTIRERIDGDSQWSEDRFGAAIADNVDYWLGRPLALLVLVASLIVIAVAVSRTLRGGGVHAVLLLTVVAAPALLPFAWFELASNHSQVHFWFTYRSLPIGLGVVLLAVLSQKPGRSLEAWPVA
jgi:hypothetical protein